MKKLFSISLFSLCSVFANAQAYIYHTMPDSNAVWRVDHNFTPCGPPYLNSSYQYTMGVDTTVGIYTYKKIYKSGMGFCGGSGYYFSNYYVGGMRQDSINKKVYFVFPGFGDTLLYDFNLNVGDTMHTVGAYLGDPTNPASYSYIITSIDSVLVGSNYHKRYNTVPFSGFSIIEGVGGTCGLIEPLISYIDDQFILQCFTHNTAIYPSSVSSCPLIANTVSINKWMLSTNGISIAPNPIYDEGLLELNDKSELIINVNIYNSFGVLIHQSQNLSLKKFKINRTDFAPGIYLIKVSSSKDKLFVTKFIVD